MTLPTRHFEKLFSDHDMLVHRLGAPSLWQEIFAEQLDGDMITEVTVAPVGTGQVASCLRIILTHASSTAPSSVVVKTASSDPTSRNTSAALRHAEVEVAWYTHLAPSALVNCPLAYVAELSAPADDFVLVLEDLRDAEQGDQIAGMQTTDLMRSLAELAALHATSWNLTPDGTDSWLVGRADPHAHAVLLSMLHTMWVDRYQGRLDASVLKVAEQLVAVADAYLVDRPGPSALAHGDFRPDNLLVGTNSVHVVDWQTVTIGVPWADLAYVIGGALDPDVRREAEPDLISGYQSELETRGVHVGRQEITDGCRRYALDGLVMAIGASQVVGRTDRGDDMFCAMAQRSAAHAIDAGTLDLFQR